MKKLYIFIVLLFSFTSLLAQNVGIGTTSPNASALLELQSTNRGLLLPRVADTNAVPSPAKGLFIFANATNSTWFYDGAKWQGASTDGLWSKYQDSIAVSQKKYIGINTDYNLYPAKQGIHANGSLLIHQEMDYTKAAPTVAQTHTMDNLSTIYNSSISDSTLRVFDPGGSNNSYFNNGQGNVRFAVATAAGVQISFNAADFGIAQGDTLWVSRFSFPNCRINYEQRFTNNTQAPSIINVNSGSVYLIFRSNGDNNNSNGFDITCKALYKKNKNESSTNIVGNALQFNGAFGSLSAGNGNTANGQFSAAFGQSTTSSGIGSTAMGGYTYSTGHSSTAMGYSTAAIGDNSTATGYSTTASGFASTAMGENTTASGENSTAMGYGTNSRAYASLALGAYNDSIASSNSTLWINTDPLLYIGNSNSRFTRSNAMVVYKNANVDINGYTRLGKLSESAPIIKMKELSGTTAPTNTGFLDISLDGIDATKVLSVSMLVSVGNNAVPPAYDYAPRLKYNYLVNNSGNIVIVNSSSDCATAGDHICSKPVKILVTYKE